MKKLKKSPKQMTCLVEKRIYLFIISKFICYFSYLLLLW